MTFLRAPLWVLFVAGAVLCLPVEYAHARQLPHVFEVTAVADVVPHPVGCGFLFLGTPVEFRVARGPKALPYRRISAVVPCLDFFGGYFAVGESYTLKLTRDNVHRIGTPDHLTEPSHFYLIEAMRRGDGEKLTWPAK